MRYQIERLLILAVIAGGIVAVAQYAQDNLLRLALGVVLYIVYLIIALLLVVLCFDKVWEFPGKVRAARQRQKRIDLDRQFANLVVPSILEKID